MAFNSKIWFIIVENQQKGPYSLFDLKRNRCFTPDTLVWKKGFQEWIPARFVPELKTLFKDEPESKGLHDKEDGKGLKSNSVQEAQATMALQQDPYQIILWLIVLLLIVLYAFYRFYE